MEKGKTRLSLELKNASEDSVIALGKEFDSLELSNLTTSNGLQLAALEYPNSFDYREDIFSYALKNKWTILEMSRHKTSLEDVFRNLTVEGGITNE